MERARHVRMWACVAVEMAGACVPGEGRVSNAGCADANAGSGANARAVILLLLGFVRMDGS